MGAVDWTGAGPQTWSFGVEAAGSIVDGNRIDLCLLVALVGQVVDWPGAEGMVWQLRPRDLAHHS